MTVNVTENIEATSTLLGSVADFPVERSPVSFERGTYPDREVIYRSDTGRPLAVVSSKYSLVSNRQCFQMIEGALRAADQEYRCSVGLTNQDARFRAIYILPGVSIEARQGERLSAALLAEGSYDGSTRQLVNLGAFSWVCANLTHGCQKIFGGGFRSLHRGDLEGDIKAAVPMISELIERFPARAEMFQHWASELWTADAREWVEAEMMSTPGMARHAARMAQGWKQEGTVWGAYNVGTAYATRNCRSVPTSYRVGETINRVFSQFWEAWNVETEGENND